MARRVVGILSRVALLLGVVTVVICGAGMPSARADDLTYSKLDEATVRVFSLKRVDVVNARSPAGFAYAMGTPDAGHGSGVLLNRSGLILTARHVIEDARMLAVQLPGAEHPLPAELVYSDKEHDTAFLVVASDTPQFIELPAEKPKLNVRETVYVVGYPLDASRARPQSEQGIVSGVLPDGSLQLGIALNPGNSGGPVVDAQERFIGIAVKRGDPRAGAQGIGVAVPLEVILPAYVAVLKSPELPAARSRLAQAAGREQARAELLMTLLTADDANNAWSALGGKPGVPSTSPSVDRQLALLARSNNDSPETLSLAAAQAWNAAAVDQARNQPAEAHLATARQLAQRAAALDSGLVRRSPFIAYVLTGRNPAASAPVSAADRETDLAAEAEARQGESGGGTNILPVLRIGPTMSLHVPFQLVGIGATAKMFLADRVSIDARYAYGYHFVEDLRTSHYAELLLGVALGTWVGTPASSHSSFYTRPYIRVHALSLEAGVLTGQVNLTSFANGVLVGNRVPTQVSLPQVGLRYTHLYWANAGFMTDVSRHSVEASLHVLGPLLGAPDNAANADGALLKPSSFGYAMEVDWQTSYYAGQSEVSLGYLPQGQWLTFRFGWSYLFY